MFFLRILKMIVDAVTEDASPKRLAWGFAWGALIGLVPKDNFIAAALVVVLCTLRVNLAAGFGSAFLFSWFGPLTDPVAHWVGQYLLCVPTLVPFWTSLYNLPGVPWTAFNNTVVLGSLVMGLILLYPLRIAGEPVAVKCLPHIHDRLNKWQATKWLSRAELVAKVGRG